MKLVIIILCLASGSAFAKRAPASEDKDAAMLVELQRTLELAAAHEDQKTPAEAPIIERHHLQASDHPEYRKD